MIGIWSENARGAASSYGMGDELPVRRAPPSIDGI